MAGIGEAADEYDCVINPLLHRLFEGGHSLPGRLDQLQAVISLWPRAWRRRTRGSRNR